MSDISAQLNDSLPEIDVKAHLRKTFLLSMIMPALLLVFFWLAPSWLDYRLHEQVETSIQKSIRMTPKEKTQRLEALKSLDFDVVATSNDPHFQSIRADLEREGIVGQFRRLHAAHYASIGLCVLLFAGFSAVYVLGRKAAESREALIAMYRSAWLVSVVVAIAQLLLLVPLMTYGSFEITVLAFDRYVPKLIILIVLGGVCALWLSAKVLLQKVPMEFQEDMARAVSQAEAPELWTAVRAAAATVNTSPPDAIVLGMQFNFYVTELSVIHSQGRTEGRVLYLSLPLLRQMQSDEIMAIIGHELGHFIGDDTRLSREFYPMRFKAQRTHMAIAASSFVGWPSYKLLEFFMCSFGEVEQRISRERELLADKVAARLTSPQIAAKALVRFHVLDEAFGCLLRDSEMGSRKDLFAVSWSDVVRKKVLADEAFWPALFKKNTPHPMDSHPDLQSRLTALGQSLTIEQAKAIAVVEGATAYEAWLSGRDGLFTDIVQQADTRISHIAKQQMVSTADILSEEGQALLVQHFPMVVWPTRSSRFWLLIGGCGFVMGVLALLMTTVVKGSIGGLIFGALCVVVAFSAYTIWRRHRKASFTLTAEGVMHSSWTRVLSFEEVEKCDLTNNHGSYTVTFRLKHAQRPRWPLSLVFWRQKSLSLDMSWYVGKQEENLATLHRYFTRSLE